jgi:hypothetical protein
MTPPLVPEAQTVALWSATVGGVIAAALVAWRRWSKTELEVGKDDAELRRMKWLEQDQRDAREETRTTREELERERAARQALQLEFAEFKAKHEAFVERYKTLQEQMTYLKDDIAQMQIMLFEQLPEELRRFLPNNFGRSSPKE